MTGPRIIVLPDAHAVATAAATRLVARVAVAQAPVTVCLTGGSTPKHLYELLSTPSWREQLPFERVHWFLGDDRFVPPDDPLSNLGMARKALLDACAAPGTMHPIPTDAGSPRAAAQRYEDELKAMQQRRGERPLFDLTLLGIGPDGHIASLFPGDPALEETQRWAVGVAHANVAPFVPRVSLTLPALGRSREILVLVTGEAKRDIARRVLAGEDLPAGRLRSGGDIIWLMDAAAAPPGVA
jgi:6-phosphogluconolactonase